jgi:hypothetical protein
VTKALRHDGIMPSIPGPIMSKWQEEKTERNRRSLARLTRALPRIFPSAVLSRALGRPFVPPTPRLAVDSYWVHIHFALIVWRAPLLPAVERLAAGPGGSTRTARTGCQPHSVHHPRPIGNMHTRWAQAFAVCAGNRFIASAGMSNCGTPGLTRLRSGTAHAWSHGNSGPRRVITRGFCGACKHGAAPRLGLVFGRTQRLTTASHYSGFGLNTVTFPGLSCSDSGACPTSKSLTVTSTSQNVRAKCGIGARPALGVRVSLIA